MNDGSIKPLLKWAGGKRQLLPVIKECIPLGGFARYIEPFIGGGALLFDLCPHRALINDYNDELTNLYIVVRDESEELIRLLYEYQEKHSSDFFYSVRALDRKDDYKNMSNVERAARTVYLNRTCYNGLYRVSRNGYFNTPIGRYKNPQIVNEYNIRNMSDYLNKNAVTIFTGDFEVLMKRARRNDFVYLDPPYYPLTETSSFTDYTSNGFSENDQLRLKNQCDNLSRKGSLFLQSNSDCDFINTLYAGYYIRKVEVRRSINSDGTSRKNMSEVLIANYPI